MITQRWKRWGRQISYDLIIHLHFAKKKMKEKEKKKKKRFRDERKREKKPEKDYMFTQKPVKVRAYVFIDRYSQDKGYTFFCRNEVSKRVCQAASVKLWDGWYGCEAKV